MMKRVYYFFVFITIFIIFITPRASFAVSPSNSGMVGLWEYPTAEMPGDGRGFVSYSDFSPYRTGAIDLGLFPWMEFNIRISEFTNTRDITESYGPYKDKAVDLKLLLLEQRGFIPSVAAGVLDMTGTEIRKAYFGAATWRLGTLAFTAGYATDTYNGFYGGLSWTPLDWLEFKAEYSPLDYPKDRAGGQYIHPEEADKKYNVGVVLKSPWGLNASLSYQRGEEFCFGVNYAFDLTKPLFGGVNKPKTAEPLTSGWADTDTEAMASSIQSELGKKGFGLRNVVVLAGDRNVHIAFENIGYSSQAEGIARAVILAAYMTPWDTERFSCSPMVRGAPVVRVELSGEQLALVRLKKFTLHDIQKSSYSWAPKTRYGTLPEQTWQVMAGPGESVRNGAAEIRVALALEPRIDRALTQSLYVDRKDIDYIGRLRSSSGWEAYLKVRQPIENNVDIWWEPEMSDKTRIWKGVLSYVHKFDKNLWGLGEIGYLDHHYFGANVWGRYYINESPFWVGGRATVFKERDYDSFGGLADYKYRVDENFQAVYQSRALGENDWATAYWAEGGYHDATYNADITARYGKFADSDKGYRLDAQRHWNDTIIGFYFTDTDNKTPGKSYTDAGMYLHIPLAQWYGGHPSNTYYDQEFTLLSTFVVDGGRIPGAWMTPERLIGELRPDALSQELGPLMDRLMSQVRDDGEPETSVRRAYGIYEYLTGEWRVNEALNEEQNMDS